MTVFVKVGEHVNSNLKQQQGKCYDYTSDLSVIASRTLAQYMLPHSKYIRLIEIEIDECKYTKDNSTGRPYDGCAILGIRIVEIHNIRVYTPLYIHCLLQAKVRLQTTYPMPVISIFLQHYS